MSEVTMLAPSLELQSQVVRREGADEMLAFMEGLNAEKLVLEKAVAHVKAWSPEDINSDKVHSEDFTERLKAETREKLAISMSRNVKDSMRVITQTAQFYRGVDLKQAKLKRPNGGEVGDMTDEQVQAIAGILNGTAKAVPIKEVTVEGVDE